MKDSHDKEETYDPEEVLVVLLANAVIEPATVMIEPTDASVALAAVLCLVLHVRFTHLAVKLKWRVVKVLSI